MMTQIPLRLHHQSPTMKNFNSLFF
jgi:hypothetical protein